MRVCNDPIVFWYFELPTSVMKLPLFIFKLAPNKDRKLYMYIEVIIVSNNADCTYIKYCFCLWEVHVYTV